MEQKTTFDLILKQDQCACIVDAVVAYDEPKKDQVFIFLINQTIEIKDLNHHLLCQSSWYLLPVRPCMPYR